MPMEQPDAPITLDRAKALYRESISATSSNDALCVRDSKYFHGDQLSAEVRTQLDLRGQPKIYVNKISPAINGILGIIDAAESDPQCYPRSYANQDAADIGTKMLRYLGDKADMPSIRRTMSESFFIEGTCAVLIGDGNKSGDKEINVTPIFWEDFFADPLSKRNDFGDARYLGQSKWVDLEELKTLYPEYGDHFEGAISGGEFFDSKTSSSDQRNWIDRERRRLRLIEMYYLGVDGWYRMVISDCGMIEAGRSVYVDDTGRSICPIIATSFEVNRTNGDRYGAIRHMIPLQDEINARRSKLLHMTNNRQVQKISPDAEPVSEAIVRREASKADGIMPFGWQASTATDIAEGQVLILNKSEADLDRMAPTPAVLGRMSGSDSGRARQILQQAGYTEWSRAFSRIEALMLQIYRHLWFAAKQFITEPTMVRVTSELRAPQFIEINVPQMGMVPQPVLDPTGQPVIDPMTGQPAIQLVPGVVKVDKAVAEMDVDIVLNTVEDTSTLEQEVWAEMLRYAASTGVSVLQPEFRFLIMASPLPNKSETLDRLESIAEKAKQEVGAGQEQQSQMAQEMAARQAQQMEAKAAKDFANARKNEADAAAIEIQTHEQRVKGEYLRGLAGFQPPEDA